MATMKIEITRIMILDGSTDYKLLVDGVIVKEGKDISEIQSVADAIKDGFKRGEFELKTIYTKNVTYP